MREALGDRPSTVGGPLLDLFRGESVEDVLRTLRAVGELVLDLP
jgi:hypothetical protein